MAHVTTDLVEQTSTSTGTGDIVVAGTVAYRRTFANSLSDGDTIDCMIVASDGSYEHGRYAWDEAGGALVRGGAQYIFKSTTGGNSPVDFAAGNKKVYSTTASATQVRNVKHVYDQAGPPTVDDDDTVGFSKGSLWEYSDHWFLCYNPGTGVARWGEIASSDSVYAIDSPKIRVRSAYSDFDANTTYFKRGLTFNNTGELAVDAWADGAIGGLFARTADATPKKMAYGDDYGTYNGIWCEANSVMSLTGRVIALVMGSAGAGYAVWDVNAVITADGSAALTIRSGATPTVVDDGGALNAAAASIAVVVAANDVSIEVTGVVATDIMWSATLVLAQAVDYT